MSTLYFLAGAFRLPSQCINEIEQLCSAFPWSGPELKSTEAKVAWQDVCKPINEGGLGIRALKEVNIVYGLKLIWRMLVGDSLWGKWIKSNLLKKKRFWEVSGNTQMGSWIWRKILKVRGIAKTFHMKEVGNGRHTSFWYDKWCDLGVLAEILGDRGIIDMGIRREATVEEVLNNHWRRRRHRGASLQDIERELSKISEKQSILELDKDLWRWSSGFKQKFSTTETWQLIRETGLECDWGRKVWFYKATPKFAFIT